jgi:hypothetical protein
MEYCNHIFVRFKPPGEFFAEMNLQTQARAFSDVRPLFRQVCHAIPASFYRKQPRESLNTKESLK